MVNEIPIVIHILSGDERDEVVSCAALCYTAQGLGLFAEILEEN